MDVEIWPQIQDPLFPDWYEHLASSLGGIASTLDEGPSTTLLTQTNAPSQGSWNQTSMKLFQCA